MASRLVFVLSLEDALLYFLCRCVHHFMGGGGGVYSCFILMIFVCIFEILKSAPSLTMWLNGRWFRQIVDRDLYHGVKWKVASPDSR